MAILEFSASGPKRKGVGYVGEAPSENDKQQFRDRGYSIDQYTDAMLRDRDILAATDSIVFTQNVEKPTRIYEQLETYAALLLNFDCRIYIRVASQNELQGVGQKIVTNAIADLGLPSAGLEPFERKLAPYVFVGALSWTELAQHIARNSAGSAPNFLTTIFAVNAKGDPISFEPDEDLLVRRAFADCKSIQLFGMVDGLSGVMAFRAYAELEQGLHGPWTMPFFVKLGIREKIAQEYDKYQWHAIYLPFHLGPRLDRARCGLGAFKGILVSDYVEDAETLKTCAGGGRSALPIATLFNRTLRQWYGRAKETSQKSIPDYLDRLFPDQIPDHRLANIRALGAKLELTDLKKLFRSRTSTPVVVGLVHGDLHATNVLARASDAVVIDFEKVEVEMPILYDAASLEAGLLVDAFADTLAPSDLLTALRPLYADGALTASTASCHPGAQCAWFFDAVRQIRLHARQFERHSGQYATALAVALLRKSCNEREFADHRQGLRAAAFVIGEVILTA